MLVVRARGSIDTLRCFSFLAFGLQYAGRLALQLLSVPDAGLRIVITSFGAVCEIAHSKSIAVLLLADMVLESWRVMNMVLQQSPQAN